MTQASFPQSARLKRPSEFSHALKGRRIARGALFTLICQRAQPEHPEARLGLIIAKRFAKRAATRNALKRVARESFRHERLQLAAGDYIVRLHAPAPPMSLTALKRQARQELDQHFRNAPRIRPPAHEHL